MLNTNVIHKVGSRYRYSTILLKQFVKTDFKLRYQGSFLGYLWSLLKPLFLFAILYTVFVKILKVDYGVPGSGVYLLLGLVVWSFFSELTGGSVASVVGRGDLIRKLNFPKYIVVMSTAFSALINLLLNMIVVGIFVAISGVSLNANLIFVPFLFLELFVFALAVGLFLSATYVKLRDVGYIWDVITQALFYATPILFPVGLAPLWAQKILILNPIAQTVQDLRYCLVSSNVITIDDIYNGNHLSRLIPVLLVAVTFWLAVLYFRAKSKNFAENI